MNERDLLQAGFRYALSLCHSRHDAEDFVQEAWLRLGRKTGSVRDKPLLFTAIRNLYIDHYRRGQRIAFTPLTEVTEMPSGDPPLDSRVTAKDLEAPLAALRPEEREALFLHVVEGYTAQEIADMTEQPRGTVLSLIYRAKRKLHKEITAALGGEPASRRGSGSRTHD